jgi:transposase
MVTRVPESWIPPDYILDLRARMFGAAQVARRPTSPDRGYYEQAADGLRSNRACLAIARKLLKRSYHTLRELGEEALQPA